MRKQTKVKGRKDENTTAVVTEVVPEVVIEVVVILKEDQPESHLEEVLDGEVLVSKKKKRLVKRKVRLKN
jgi:hypothetical protein